MRSVCHDHQRIDAGLGYALAQPRYALPNSALIPSGTQLLGRSRAVLVSHAPCVLARRALRTQRQKAPAARTPHAVAGASSSSQSLQQQKDRLAGLLTQLKLVTSWRDKVCIQQAHGEGVAQDSLMLFAYAGPCPAV